VPSTTGEQAASSVPRGRKSSARACANRTKEQRGAAARPQQRHVDAMEIERPDGGCNEGCVARQHEDPHEQKQEAALADEQQHIRQRVAARVETPDVAIEREGERVTSGR
jgi:hypothetical protein